MRHAAETAPRSGRTREHLGHGGQLGQLGQREHHGRGGAGRPAIVVGVDGSDTATAAAAWAASWAQGLGATLRLLAADLDAGADARGRIGPVGDRGGPGSCTGAAADAGAATGAGAVGGARSAGGARSERVARSEGVPGPVEGAGASTALFVREVAAVLTTHPDLPLDCVRPRADPAAALIEASRWAAGIVVGARGTGGWDDLRVGSVAHDVCAYAQCVVTVVPPVAESWAADSWTGQSWTAQSWAADSSVAGSSRRVSPVAARTDGAVVVGVDGSPEAQEAADLAAAHAATVGAPLHVISAYRPSDQRDHRAADAAHELAEAAAAEVAGDCPRLAGRVHACAVAGSPAPVLAQASREAALVVVGARGAGGFAGKLLGSTSRGLLELSARPVAIVRAGGPLAG